MKRVLFLLGAYYPYPKANGICCEKVITQLKDKGYIVDVLAFAPNWPDCKPTNWEGGIIYYIRGSFYYRLLRSQELGKSKALLSIKKKALRAKDIALTPLWPDNSKLCKKQYLDKAEFLYQKNKYELVVGVVSPISAVSALVAFKERHPEVATVAYFLDAVSAGITPRALPENIGIKLAHKWEERCLKTVDKVIYMRSHMQHHETYSVIEPYRDKLCVLDIPLICPNAVNENKVKEKKDEKKIHVVYLGSLNKKIRNPEYLLKLAQKMPSDIVFDFYGNIDCLELFDKYQSENINIYGSITKEQAETIQKNADVLLNIGNNDSGFVPSKIFEYMSTCKPIVSVYRNPNDQSKIYLEKYELAFQIYEENECLEQNRRDLSHFITGSIGLKADPTCLVETFKENTPEMCAEEIIKTITKNSSANDPFVNPTNDTCCGCGACKAVCPVKAIELVENKEGFLYPHVDLSICKKCGICRQVCPFVTISKETKAIKAYAAINNNPEILKNSSSGGVFSAIAEAVLRENGVVYGTIINNNKVEFRRIDKPEDLPPLRGSKYVQSFIGNTLEQIIEDVDADKLILFTGTPCQCAAVKNLTGQYEKLITLDFVCHGVPSPAVFRDYLNWLNKRYNQEVSIIGFRSKNHKYMGEIETIVVGDRVIQKRIFESPYLTGFIRGIINRSSCYNCPYAKIHRSSDLTMCDFWGCEDYHKEIDSLKGVSGLIINTHNGLKWVNHSSNNISMVCTDINNIAHQNHCLTLPCKKPNERDQFFKDRLTMDFDELIKKYLTDNKSWMKRVAAYVPKDIKSLIKTWIIKKK